MFGVSDFSKAIIDFSNFDFSQIGSAVIFGASILLIGMVTIFAVLCILWLFLFLFKIVFHDLPKKKASKEVLTPVTASDNVSEQTAPKDEEIVAVIAAAIAMAESNSPDSKFRVVSFRRT